MGTAAIQASHEPMDKKMVKKQIEYQISSRTGDLNMHTTMKNRTQLRLMLSPISLFLLAVYTVSAFYAFFSVEAFAGDEQRNDSNPLMVVAPISTDEWRDYLSDILRTKPTNKEKVDKLQEMALDCSNRANTAIGNASTSSGREDAVRLGLRGHVTFPPKTEPLQT